MSPLERSTTTAIHVVTSDSNTPTSCACEILYGGIRFARPMAKTVADVAIEHLASEVSRLEAEFALQRMMTSASLARLHQEHERADALAEQLDSIRHELRRYTQAAVMR